MKSILVPTDFSECAGFALNAAVRLARRFDAKVFLLHQLALPTDWKNLIDAERKKHPAALKKIARTEDGFTKIIDQYADVPFETIITDEKLAPDIADYVDQYSIDLIVMGSHGSGGKNAYFIGTNTQRVARTVHCPLLVIKEPVPDINFDRVVFASSFNENELPAFQRFKDFVKPFIPEIHLVAIHTSSLFDPPYIVTKEAMDQFKAHCSPFACGTHVLKGLSIDQGIRSFAENIGAKLIGISNHYRHPMKRILVGSNVEALINHANTPVLCIDYPKQETKV